MSHLEELDRERSLSVCVLTISDTRIPEEDTSGMVIRRKLEEAGHLVAETRICRDDPHQIAAALVHWFENDDIDGIITTGGTGISHRDVTIETVSPFFTKTLDGFGELFRYVSYTEDVGSKALLSRATAGTVQNQAVFVLPGSSKAVALAMEKLILPEIHHIVHELKKHLTE
ncbi:MogA/MoaB family molybdenum cofactor biosynthesis protein [Sporosarcina sp. FSL W7-1349]|uniref:MogA/MoaB family molybdenum cofactor biosynthesis protein n=1 Tax=Sporosarcina sp. FSL W7-1349 TaxID=2921561 RepID=UPI0030FB8F04